MLAMKRVPRPCDESEIAAFKLGSFEPYVRANRYVITPRRSVEATPLTSRDDLRAPINAGCDVARESVTGVVKRRGPFSQERSASFRPTTRQTLRPSPP